MVGLANALFTTIAKQGKKFMSGAARFFWRVVKMLLLLVLLLAVLGLGFAYYVGAWHIVFPSSQHDTKPPLIPVDLEAPAILVFSKTNQFRHVEGIEAGTRALSAIALKRGWGLFATENGAVFNTADLQRFKAVVFLNATGDTLNAAQQQAFRAWLEAGGGWFGIHAAGDGSHSGWPWYMKTLIGAEFTAHTLGPQFQIASVIMEHHQHPVAANMPNIWEHEDEWYSWKSSPRNEGFTVLATVDEDSYTPRQKVFTRELDLSMGDHPVVWSSCVDRGRGVYSALGHSAEAFSRPRHLTLLENALGWALGVSAGGCPQAGEDEQPGEPGS